MTEKHPVGIVRILRMLDIAVVVTALLDDITVNDIGTAVAPENTRQRIRISKFVTGIHENTIVSGCHSDTFIHRIIYPFVFLRHTSGYQTGHFSHYIRRTVR